MQEWMPRALDVIASALRRLRGCTVKQSTSLAVKITIDGVDMEVLPTPTCINDMSLADRVHECQRHREDRRYWSVALNHEQTAALRVQYNTAGHRCRSYRYDSPHEGVAQEVLLEQRLRTEQSVSRGGDGVFIASSL